jgi:hypothetical protein
MLMVVKVANVSLWHLRYLCTSVYSELSGEVVIVREDHDSSCSFSLLPFWVIPEQGFTDK